ncbi:hypothetical protein DAPPUDRAFT_117586 [Daphnia pulex]|uniref:Uncharacterized protein n=1 Tax=Daphnia pulex TaxID=6669 RepID=E9HT69_DAPPU|nr:hypothetical protein DAPPUDRAFT_117586 [Daphnia pulex]|eukprot:EFX65064.1 hypothetical protein DAPPUDRAFT_117586 [Daphnia pulex]
MKESGVASFGPASSTDKCNSLFHDGGAFQNVNVVPTVLTKTKFCDRLAHAKYFFCHSTRWLISFYAASCIIPYRLEGRVRKFEDSRTPCALWDVGFCQSPPNSHPKLSQEAKVL